MMVRAVTGVLRAGRSGSALFQRASGDLTLRALMRRRRGGSRLALGGRQRFCTSEGIRPVRLPEINFGAVAHRAMWGYGVGPPSAWNPSI